MFEKLSLVFISFFIYLLKFSGVPVKNFIFLFHISFFIYFCLILAEQGINVNNFFNFLYADGNQCFFISLNIKILIFFIDF